MREHRPEGLNILVPEERRRAIAGAITRRQALSASVAGLAGLYLAGCGGQSGSGGGSGAASSGTPAASKLKGKPIESSLLLANWADYSNPVDYKSYTKKLGPKITVEGYGSNDELIAKLSAGGSAYDVVVPSASYVPECIQKGLLMPLDHSLIPNLKNLEAAFTKTKYDPGNKYSITKDYGITSFYYRADVVKDPPKTIQEWFQELPKYKGKNVNFIEGGSETWGMFMLGAGKDESSTDPADYEAALKVALSVKPAIKTINSTYIERLGQGQIDIGLGWNGDVLRGKFEAAKKGIEIGFTVPEGAGEYWTDNWTVVADAKNPVAAHAWINYVLQPEIAGQEWGYHGYKVPVTGAEQHVDPKMAKDPMIDVPQETLAGYSTTIVTPELSDLVAKYYTKFKA